MRFLTAIDLVGLPSSPLDEWSHQLTCPWCGQDAWAISDYFQCCSPSCEMQTASPEDLLAKSMGGYIQAEHFAATKTNRAPDEEAARLRMRDRAVMDLWISFCQTPPTSEALNALNKIQSNGFGIRNSRFNAAVLDTRQTSTLIDVAQETGAIYPDSWDKQRPGVVRAFAIQTRPYTIDRIVVVSGRGRSEEIIWNRYSAGFCALMGLTPRQPRLLVSNVETMLRTQYDLAAAGQLEEVASVYLDLFGGDACPRWDVQAHLLTAAPRYCQPQSNPDFFCPDDVVRIQQALDQFPGVEESVRALPIDLVMKLHPRDRAVAWPRLRYGMIASMVPEHAAQVPPACASVFEQTGTKTEDAVSLVSHFKKEGRQHLADDFELLALTRIISRDARATIKETANDYRLLRGSDTTLLANFSLKINAGVTFRNHNASRYCQATLRCGQAVMDVVFPQNLLHDRVQSLEEELQRQLTSADKAVTEARLMPTVIETNKFRNHVVPHLRAQAAAATPIRGVDLLGWSEDRKTFTFPGFVVTASGAEPTSSILCPAIPILKLYRPVPLADWAESCQGGLDQSCHDIVAMLMASCVRYFRRCVTKPIQIAQSSEAMTALDRISRAMGQKEIHPLNQNVRDSNRIEGVYGYPLLAAGPRAAGGNAGSSIPFIHLTDRGYQMATRPGVEGAEVAARAAQYCLREVVRWCAETGGDAFRETPSLMHHRSLLQEGQWLIDNVCQLKGEVSQAGPTAIEKLLAQIPYEDAGQRITLIDGQNLVIDVHGLSKNHDGILREGRDMGTIVALEGDKMMSPAVKLLPAICNYYGQEPDFTVVTT